MLEEAAAYADIVVVGEAETQAVNISANTTIARIKRVLFFQFIHLPPRMSASDGRPKNKRRNESMLDYRL